MTEPDPVPEAKYQGVEPETITVEFSGVQGTIEVIDENRNIQSVNDKFIDVFEKNAVHIYKVTNGNI